MNLKNTIYRVLSIIPDRAYLKIMYRIRMHKKLNLENPKTFNEKLQWLKLYDRNPKYCIMADKYEVKRYIEKKIGKEYIIPTLGIFDSFKDINFDELPNQFVIKCTHDSSSVIICGDKNSLNIKDIKKNINSSLSHNYYSNGREWPYKNLKHRIIIEKYMGNNLKDYKFFCFNGKAKFFKIDFDRYSNHRANYYDINGGLQHFGEVVCPPNYDKILDMPINLSSMIKLANKLSKGIPFLRVDFYEINEKVYFGELTFFPASGFGKFDPIEWDNTLGKLIDLQNKK